MNFAIKYLIEIERFGSITKNLNSQECFFNQLVISHGEHYQKKTYFEVFSSYFRELELIKDDDEYWFLWDKSLLNLINNIVYCISVNDFEKSQQIYAKYYEMYLLENAIKNNSKLTKGIFISHLRRCGTGFAKKNVQTINDTNFYGKIASQIEYFSFFHELSHFIIQVDDLEKNLQKINVDNVFDVIANLSGQFHPLDDDISKDDYIKLIQNFLSNDKSLEEIECDISAINLSLETITHDIPTLSLLYLSSILQYKIMASLSNARRLLDLLQENRNSNLNYIENRIRVDFRCYSLMLSIANRFNQDLTIVEKLDKFYKQHYKLIVEKFDTLRIPVEKYFMSSEYWDAVNHLNLSQNVRIPKDKHDRLNILGWL